MAHCRRFDNPDPAIERVFPASPVKAAIVLKLARNGLAIFAHIALRLVEPPQAAANDQSGALPIRHISGKTNMVFAGHPKLAALKKAAAALLEIVRQTAFRRRPRPAPEPAEMPEPPLQEGREPADTLQPDSPQRAAGCRPGDDSDCEPESGSETPGRYLGGRYRG